MRRADTSTPALVESYGRQGLIEAPVYLIVVNVQDVSDKAMELYEELYEFKSLEGRDTKESLKDIYWEFVDEKLGTSSS